MQLIDGRPVYAATDLVGYLACDHRLALERAALAGLVEKPIRNDPSIELVAKRGLEHEHRYLEELREQGLRVVEIEKDGSAVGPLDDPAQALPRDAGAELRAAAEQTIEAMRSGADVVYQATFFDGTWRGHADFLLRRDHVAGEPDSAFGPWHYEVADTKLARHVKASAILQICSYVEQLTAVQGLQPELLHVVLGGRERPTDTLRVDDYMAYYRRVKADFETAVGLRGEARPAVYPPVGTYPEPVEHCDVCRWNPACKARRRTDDDLSLVAGAASRQRRALKARGVATRRGLAVLPLPMDPKLEGVGAGALERIRDQARIQVESEDRREVLWELLPLDRGADGAPVPDRGLLGLPEPRPGDLFLDLEGDPFALDDGIDYLFGILEPDAPETDPRWARPDGGPGPAVPRVLEHRRRGPGHLGRREGGLRAHRRPDRRPARARPGHPRLSLRRVRAHRAGTARAAPRHPRGGGRPPPPRRRARRPVQGGPPGRPGGRRELLDQANRAPVRARARGGAEGRREQHRRVRDVARAGLRGAGRGRGPDPRRDRRLQPRRRGEQLAPPRLAGGPAARPRGPRGRGAAEARGRRRRRVARARRARPGGRRGLRGSSRRASRTTRVDRAPAAGGGRPLAPRAAADLAPPGGQVGLVALLRAAGHDRRRAARGARAARGPGARVQRAAQEVDGVHVLVPAPGPSHRRGQLDRRSAHPRARRAR